MLEWPKNRNLAPHTASRVRSIPLILSLSLIESNKWSFCVSNPGVKHECPSAKIGKHIHYHILIFHDNLDDRGFGTIFQSIKHMKRKELLPKKEPVTSNQRNDPSWRYSNMSSLPGSFFPRPTNGTLFKEVLCRLLRTEWIAIPQVAT